MNPGHISWRWNQICHALPASPITQFVFHNIYNALLTIRKAKGTLRPCVRFNGFDSGYGWLAGKAILPLLPMTIAVAEAT